jgi:hypothetical protein
MTTMTMMMTTMTMRITDANAFATTGHEIVSRGENHSALWPQKKQRQKLAKTSDVRS